MKSVPSPEHVLADLGDKSVRAFTLAVQRTRADLVLYRQIFGQWVADASERGLANWINDRMWAHLKELADAIPDMTVMESGATREVTVGIAYRFRFKRHKALSMIASYPTEGFLDFLKQPTGHLPGMEEVRLVAGYEWKPESRDMGDAVISLRNGKDNVLWTYTLPALDDDVAGGTAQIVTPHHPGPLQTIVDLPDSIGRPEEESQDQ